MAVVCPSCGVENRDKARFCLGCAALLDRAVDATPEAPVASRSRKPRGVPAAKVAEGDVVPGRGALKAGGLGALVLVAALVGWWLWGHQTRPVASMAAPSAVPTLAQPLPFEALPVGASTVPVASGTVVAPPSSAAVSAAERLRESVEGLAERDRLHQRELEQQRARIAREVQQAEEARRRAEGLSVSRSVGAESAKPEPVPAAGVAATVDQVCSGSGNFLARDFCRIRECGKASFASDPVCVRFRQMDEARRQQSN